MDLETKGKNMKNPQQFMHKFWLSLVCALFLSITGTQAMADAQTDYLKSNAKAKGVKVTQSGLQYKVLKQGSGKTPGASDRVEVHYLGKLIDGKQFDSSYDRGQTITFPLNGVIKGWTEGLQLMKEGAKYEFVIPANLAYGTRGAGGVIPPGATLVFEVELVKVVN